MCVLAAAGPSGGERRQLTVATVNVNALGSNGAALAEVGRVADVVALQEVRVREGERRCREAEARQRGFDVCWGPLLRVRQTARGERTACGGVAVAVRAGTPSMVVRSEGEQMADELWESERCVHAQVAVGDGKRSVHVLSVYGKVGDSRAASDLMRKVFAYGSSLGDVPVLGMGDLNLRPLESPEGGAALNTGRWVDVAEQQAQQTGETPVATCVKAEGGTRIDYILANRVAAAAVTRVWVDEDSPVWPHRPVYASLDLEVFGERAPRPRRPEAFPLGTGIAVVDEADTAKALELAAAVGSAADVDPDVYWGRFCGGAEEFLLWKTRHAEGRREDGEKRLRGRGEVLGDVWRKGAAREGATECGAADSVTLKLEKTCRRLEELQRLGSRRAGPGCATVTERSLWHKAREVGRGMLPSVAWPDDVPAEETLGALRTALMQEKNRIYVGTEAE